MHLVAAPAMFSFKHWTYPASLLCLEREFILTMLSIMKRDARDHERRRGRKGWQAKREIRQKNPASDLIQPHKGDGFIWPWSKLNLNNLISQIYRLFFSQKELLVITVSKIVVLILFSYFLCYWAGWSFISHQNWSSFAVVCTLWISKGTLFFDLTLSHVSCHFFCYSYALSPPWYPSVLFGDDWCLNIAHHSDNYSFLVHIHHCLFSGKLK